MNSIKITVILAVAMMLTFAFGIFAGAEFISPLAIFRGAAENSPYLFALLKLRLLRMSAAMVIGASLATAGAILQAALRNPLAEPFSLGISGGAGLGAAVAIIGAPRFANVYGLQIFAFAGALGALLLVLAISGGKKFWRAAAAPTTVLLSGVIVSALAGSCLMYLTQAADHQELARVIWWLLGDLQAATFEMLLLAALWLLIALIILRYYAADINALAISAAAAWNGGVSPARLTAAILIIASLLTAATVALAGIIGFCGLVVPAIARRLFGCDYRRSLLLAALLGATFLMSADVLSRLIFPAKELPIGVISALLGSPVFLYLLNRRAPR